MSIERHGLQLQRGQAEAVPVAPKDFHHLLATASLFVGDSQSVAAEAAILGVPSLRLSGFTGTTFYLHHLEGLGLIQNFSPGEENDLLDALASALSWMPGRAAAMKEAGQPIHDANFTECPRNSLFTTPFQLRSRRVLRISSRTSAASLATKLGRFPRISDSDRSSDRSIDRTSCFRPLTTSVQSTHYQSFLRG